jgi:hypothetical protein
VSDPEQDLSALTPAQRARWDELSELETGTEEEIREILELQVAIGDLEKVGEAYKITPQGQRRVEKRLGINKSINHPETN